MKKGKVSFKEFYSKLDKSVVFNVPVALISTIFILYSLNYSTNEISEILKNFGYENAPEVLEHIYKTLIGLMGCEVGLFGVIPLGFTLKDKTTEKINDYFLVNGVALDILNEEELEELQCNIKKVLDKKQVRYKNKEQ